MEVINICEKIGSKAISDEQGQKIQKLLVEKLNAVKENQSSEQVVLDFSNMDVIFAVFLNPAIGDIYSEFDEQFIKQHLSVQNVPQDCIPMIKKVVERAKAYYNAKRQ